MDGWVRSQPRKKDGGWVGVGELWVTRGLMFCAVPRWGLGCDRQRVLGLVWMVGGAGAGARRRPVVYGTVRHCHPAQPCFAASCAGDWGGRGTTHPTQDAGCALPPPLPKGSWAQRGPVGSRTVPGCGAFPQAVWVGSSRRARPGASPPEAASSGVPVLGLLSGRCLSSWSPQGVSDPGPAAPYEGGRAGGQGGRCAAAPEEEPRGCVAFTCLGIWNTAVANIAVGPYRSDARGRGGLMNKTAEGGVREPLP